MSPKLIAVTLLSLFESENATTGIAIESNVRNVNFDLEYIF
jgi:hypothetical protein